MAADRVLIRPYQDDALPALVALWNEAAAGRRNARAVSMAEFQRRVIDCPVFDAKGLLLAWQQDGAGETLVGFAHAFGPPPPQGLYRRWGEAHHLGPLYVTPQAREQGTGSRLLQGAESWLYYCPVHVLDEGMPAYGTVERIEPPFWGASERMGIDVDDRTLIQFLSKRGYRVHDPGNVSMTLDLGAHPPAPPAPFDLAALGLRLERFDYTSPFRGREPENRQYYTLIGSNSGAPYAGLALLEAGGLMVGHASWYPMRPGHAAFTNYRIAPGLRGRGLGRFLLDAALHAIATLHPPLGGFHTVELYTHVVHNAQAIRLYEARGFEIDTAWVNLVKT